MTSPKLVHLEGNTAITETALSVRTVDASAMLGALVEQHCAIAHANSAPIALAVTLEQWLNLESLGYKAPTYARQPGLGDAPVVLLAEGSAPLGFVVVAGHEMQRLPALEAARQRVQAAWTEALAQAEAREAAEAALSAAAARGGE